MLPKVSMRRIAYIPYDEPGRGNAYTFRMRDILSRFGQVKSFPGTWRAIRQIPAQGRLDAIVVNWEENIVLDRVSGRLVWHRILRLFGRAALMRLVARKTIFVRHNVYPHAVAEQSKKNTKRCIDWYEKLFDVVLTHSGAHAIDGRQYCPHPLYERVPTQDVSCQYSLPGRFVVIFGQIAPYKRIAEFADRLPDDINLVVIGSVGDKSYCEELASRRQRNFFFFPGYISEQQAQYVIERSSAVVICHADEDVVVSGTFFYALSIPKTVVAIATPFMQWVNERLRPGVLHLASDWEDLIAKSLECQAGQPEVTAQDEIQAEFGDEVLAATLGRVLGVH
jgi:glycosyltransferase involved in cell wall biosynthesis